MTEYYVRVEAKTWEQLQRYQEELGAQSADSLAGNSFTQLRRVRTSNRSWLGNGTRKNKG